MTDLLAGVVWLVTQSLVGELIAWRAIRTYRRRVGSYKMAACKPAIKWYLRTERQKIPTVIVFPLRNIWIHVCLTLLHFTQNNSPSASWAALAFVRMSSRTLSKEVQFKMKNKRETENKRRAWSNLRLTNTKRVHHWANIGSVLWNLFTSSSESSSKSSG